MNKKDEEKLVKILEGVMGNLEGMLGNQKEYVKLLERIVSLIEFLMKSVNVMSFILGMLIWRVFLWDPLNLLLDRIIGKWAQLSEGYRILVLGFIGTIVAGIISYIVGVLILEKIKDILKRKK